MSLFVREGGIFLCDCEHDLVIFLLTECVQKGQQCTLDGLDGHKRGNDGHLVDSVDSRSEVVGVQLLLEQLEGVNILHKI